MKRAFRLQASDNIINILRRGRKSETPFFRIQVRANSVSHPRFAFIVSKKIDKRATVRNTLRRRAREWFRKNTSLYSQPLDIVVTFKKGVEDMSKKDFYEALNTIAYHLDDF